MGFDNKINTTCIHLLYNCNFLVVSTRKVLIRGKTDADYLGCMGAIEFITATGVYSAQCHYFKAAPAYLQFAVHAALKFSKMKAVFSHVKSSGIARRDKGLEAPPVRSLAPPPLAPSMK